MVKNCDRGLENAQVELRQHFQAQGRIFSPYGLTISWQITGLFFSSSKLITNGFVYTGR